MLVIAVTSGDSLIVAPSVMAIGILRLIYSRLLSPLSPVGVEPEYQIEDPR